MTQRDFGTIDPAQTSGLELATLLGEQRDAQSTNHKGPTRPAYVVQGMVWLDDSGGTTVLLKYYDGATDILVGTFDETNNLFTAANEKLLHGQILPKVGSYTVVIADDGAMIPVDTTGGPVTITIPDSSALTKDFRVSVVKVSNDANAVTISRSGTDTINGGITLALGVQDAFAILSLDQNTGLWYAFSKGTGVPIPSNPGDDGKVLQAAAGIPGWGPVITNAAATLLDDTTIAAIRTTMGLGAAALLASPIPVSAGGTGGITQTAGRAGLGLVLGTDVLAPTGDGSGLTGVMLTGDHEIFVSSLAMIADTSGNVVSVGSGAGAPIYKVLPFDQAVMEYASFWIRMPAKWDEGAIDVQFVWTASAGTGVCRWGMAARAISNDDALGTAFASVLSIDDTKLANLDLHISSVGTLTPEGNPSEGDVVVFRVSRIAAHANDTLNADGQLLGVVIRPNFSAGKDA